MRVSEIYPSIQGEGPNVGKPTIFLRFGGCNLRCPGWPCDTQHAIDPAFRKEWEKLGPYELSLRVIAMAQDEGITQVTLTGGEPFLQKDAELHELVTELIIHGFSVDCFSNGTIKYPDWAKSIQFIMDWKLPGSGEDHLNDTRLENLWLLDLSAGSYMGQVPQSVKFVCKNDADFYLAMDLYDDYLVDKRIRVYAGKVWNGEMTDARLVELIMQHQRPWYLNIQTHNYVWPANERAR